MPRPIAPAPKTPPAPPGAAAAPSSGPASTAGGLALPHERDQDLGHTAAAPDPVIQQAKRDLDAGLVDTDMRATPGLDALQRERLVPTRTPAKAATRGKPDPA
jgi:hypothetical protein